MTKPVLSNQVNSGHCKTSAIYKHSIDTNNGLPNYQQPNHYGFPTMENHKSNRLAYQQDSQELRVATIAALSQQIKGKNVKISSYDIILVKLEVKAMNNC